MQTHDYSKIGQREYTLDVRGVGWFTDNSREDLTIRDSFSTEAVAKACTYTVMAEMYSRFENEYASISIDTASVECSVWVAEDEYEFEGEPVRDAYPKILWTEYAQIENGSVQSWSRGD